MDEENHWPLDELRLQRVKKRASGCCLFATVLGVALGLALAAVIGLTVVYVLKGDPPSPPTCLTPQCVELGSQVLSSLDQSVHPCDDFYKFVCNKYLQQTIIPYGETSTGPLESLSDRNHERFRALMESGNNRSVAALQKSIDYYQSCMDKKTVEAQSLSDLRQILTSLGGWPLVGIDSGRPWSINDQQGFLMEILYGSGAFFSFEAISNPYNSSQNILAVDQGGLTLPSKVVYSSDSIKQNLVKPIMMKVLQAINPSISEDVYDSAIDDILDFETEIADFTDFGSYKIDLITMSALSSYMPSFHWMQNLQFYASMGHFTLNTSAPVDMISPMQFLVELDSLIDRSNTITLNNYAKWHLVWKLLPVLSHEFSDVYYSFYKLLTDDKEPPRYKICVNMIQQQLPLALARTFTDEYFSPEAEDSMLVVLRELKQALKQRISQEDWLDDVTKKRALNKADKINEFLAYPKEIKNNAILNNIYSQLNIVTSRSYLLNYLEATRFSLLGNLGTLGHTNNRSTWDLGGTEPPTIVNAFYSPLGNQIYILEGILNFPFFKSNWPDYFKFGTIGFVVGHEFVHGFDNTGRFFDENGNLVDWWSAASAASFKRRAQCLVDQYNQYALPAGNVNGTLTLGENIADNGGLGIAYQAYKNRLDATGQRERLLPGLNYTQEQLFFIASAQPWCEIVTSDKKQNMLLSDSHTPSPLRARGFLSNSPEFAAAFQCPQGSSMNPWHKCKVW